MGDKEKINMLPSSSEMLLSAEKEVVCVCVCLCSYVSNAD